MRLIAETARPLYSVGVRNKGEPMKEVLKVTVVHKKIGGSRPSTRTIEVKRKPNSVEQSRVDRARARKELEKLFARR